MDYGITTDYGKKLWELRLNSTSNPCLEANPDISGLGVRISFYLQTIALVLLAGRNLEEALNSVWTLLGTSFGLTISALVTAVRNELPLYQAIIVTDLVWLANWAIFMALATYNRHPKGSHTVQYAAIVQTYISMSCILYLWARAPELESEGNPEHAGQTVFIVLFISTSATKQGRLIALIITTIMLLGYSIVASLFIWRHVPRPSEGKQHRGRARRASNSPAPQPQSFAMAIVPRAPVSVSPVDPTRPSANRLPPSLGVDPHLVILSLFIGLPYTITLGSTELQIHRNVLCPENTFWGFGQILAMTVTIVPVVVTVQAFRRYGWKQRPRVLPETASGADTV
ncbi:hypothetical protein B0H16DRAFT_1737076 [Mycena metata]|uniref:Uncharacterized protein n=1 Tax=Mycena metata TaxID=1033252 RepID=A0AAD7HM91_9AGAR|nr:hypothetical protein B0H16DRAFT_1737076 [Mycena metata]